MKPVRGCSGMSVIWAAVLLFLALFIVYPLARALSQAGTADWIAVIQSRRFIEAGLHSLILAVLSTSLSVVIGFLYAFAVVRGGLPFSRFFSFLPILHLITPPFVSGLSFILLFGRQGFFTRTLLGLDLSLYGLPGLLIAQTLCFFPLTYIIVKNALEASAETLENAARSLGAGAWQRFWTVTFPFTLPGIIFAALLIAISVLSDFGNPMLIGGRYTVLAVELYTQLTGWAETGKSAVLGTALLLPSIGLFAVQRILLRDQEKKLSLNLNPSSARPHTVAAPPPPPLPVRIILGLFTAFIAFIVLAQFLAVIVGAFSKIWGVDPRWTTAHFKAAFLYKTELANTLVFSLLAALITALLALIISFAVTRTALPCRRPADAAAMLPAAIPGTFLGLAYVIAFSGNPLLSGNALILILVMTVYELPAAVRILTAALAPIPASLDDSARSLGASRLTIMTTIIAPLTVRALLSAFILAFVRAAGTLSAVIFLMSFTTKLTSALILNLAAQGDWGTSAALALILTLIIFAALGAASLGALSLLTRNTRSFRNQEIQEGEQCGYPQ
jgi:iron(III) transport system permease protein